MMDVPPSRCFTPKHYISFRLRYKDRSFSKKRMGRWLGGSRLQRFNLFLKPLFAKRCGIRRFRSSGRLSLSEHTIVCNSCLDVFLLLIRLIRHKQCSSRSCENLRSNEDGSQNESIEILSFNDADDKRERCTQRFERAKCYELVTKEPI